MANKRYAVIDNPKEKSLYKYNTRIYKIVVAIFLDYDRRRRAIEKGTVEGIHLEYYKLLNNTIDEVCAKVCRPIEILKDMREDIGDGTGPYRSRCLLTISPGTFKTQKKEIVYLVAKNLKLI